MLFFFAAAFPEQPCAFRNDLDIPWGKKTDRVFNRTFGLGNKRIHAFEE
jgi:hypothetical protein